MDDRNKSQAAIGHVPCSTALYVVTIDGRPYAGFTSRTCAEEAVALWTGEVDAHGDPVPPGARERHGWAAVRGKRIEIVERPRAISNPHVGAAQP